MVQWYPPLVFPGFSIGAEQWRAEFEPLISQSAVEGLSMRRCTSPEQDIQGQNALAYLLLSSVMKKKKFYDIHFRLPWTRVTFERPYLMSSIKSLCRQDIHSGTLWYWPQNEDQFKLVLILGSVPSMGEIEILTLAVLFTNHSVLVWFFLFRSCNVLFRFDFIC